MNSINKITQEDRDVFDRIDRDCLKMHIFPPPKTFLKLEVHDANGVLTNVYEDRAHSWVRNAYNGLVYWGTGANNAASYGAGYLAIKGTGGGLGSNASTPASIFGSLGTLGGITVGIIVGTGTTAESFESYVLTTPVAHGSSANQLSYSAGVLGTPSYEAGTKTWTVTVSRIMNNNSGGSISVAEVGNLFSGPYLVCRDLIDPAVAVANAAQLTVTYTIQITFPG